MTTKFVERSRVAFRAVIILCSKERCVFCFIGVLVCFVFVYWSMDFPPTVLSVCQEFEESRQ